MAGGYYVEAGDLAGRPLPVVMAPMFSLMMALRDAAGAERSDTPEAWCRVIRAHLTRRDYEVMAPLATPRPTLVPSALSPAPAPAGQPLKDAFEQMVAAADDGLLREIDECVASGGAGDWREPARDPRRWVRGLVLAMTRAWRGFSPIWEARGERLAAEVERVTAAAERDAHLDLLGGLIPFAHATPDRWVLEGSAEEDVRLALPDRGLTLTPLVAGSRASIVDHDAGAIALLGYPLRPLNRNGSGNLRPEASLEALLGIPRARILRALDAPATNNRLAEVLQAVPSAATHHVTALASAGLVVRDRSGAGLLVRRTARGDLLLALYAGAD